MASQPNIEFEAAKFLHKLIQDSKDEPDKLAAKLYVILQHMKASGKENSLPYQVISRAMETVVNQHGLDIESLKSPPNPANSKSQIRDSINPQLAGCSQIGGAPQDSKSGLIETDSFRTEAFSSGRPPAGPSSVTNDTYPGSAPNRNAISFDHESPSSVDTRSANSTSYERRDTTNWEKQAAQKDSKRSSAKRKRLEPSVTDAHLDDSQQLDTHNTIGDARKGKLMNKMEFPGPFPGSSLEPSASTNLPERSGQGHLLSINRHEMTMGGALSNPEMSLRSGITRDNGKSSMSSTSASSMPFKEHHLKQLRAQCLVFLAFRNGLMPKRLHLELALGNTLPEEGIGADGVQRDLVDNKGKEMTMNEPNSNPHTATMKAERAASVSLFATAGESENSREEADHGRLTMQKSVPSADPAVNDEERKQILATGRVLEVEMQNQETAGVPSFLPIQSQHDFTRLKSSSNLDNSVDNRHLRVGTMNHEPSIMGMNNQPRPEMVRWAASGGQNETSRRPQSSSVVQHDLLARKDSSSSPSPPQGFGEVAIQGHQYADSNLSVPWKSMQGLNNEKQRLVPAHDAMLLRHGSSGNPSDASHLVRNHAPLPQMDNTYEPEERDKFYAGVPPPKYTTSEKWIMMQHKRKVINEENWMKKQKRVDQRIAARFNELKETVSSSEDLSAKTRSVIELKKLQLLELQRCLRSNILNDFFKPITVEIDRLKAIKKHRVGRRLKHVEKYEQRMKEERQKRVHERQKEFFSELEFHKERLDDVLKLKKERWRGFNRYVKEFHKRKERVQREKIDRIQREKINLLKINDVEGYLRMVQDAKSDRVKQLLKETEKYLQKLSAKLQEAKSNSMDENQSASVIESNDPATEIEDESDQAKHYKESNEKYYLMAHSIKENITEQPTGLQGGKLREYQMNGLRWLVSLYNNHLNGILADEMGLGKTVQVISLICYLMEAKNDRGPFLVVVPSSVLPGWESELNFWAPSINKIVYAGSPEERRRLFKESIIHQKFNVLLTTYEYLMNKHDRPKLSKVHWHYIIIDEGHRIKNASCKLNADLKHYHSSHRLLLTGTPLQNNLEELWALLNFLLPNIFNSSEDFSQWFNKPFESNGDSSPDETLLSEEENLLIINRLHQVLRPFVLRRLKHKVENQLPEKIERLVRCEASAYQKLLMKRVEENLGSLVNSKARAVHNSVMELRNICNHPYLSQLHVDEVDTLIPKHFLPPIVRLCGKLEMLDRLLPKLKATNHRVLLFSTMTRLLDVMEEYLSGKKYHYVRLDGHTSGMERGALIDQFNRSDSPYFIFLLSIRAGGVGVNLQAADTVIIFDTDWNPQVDLQAQARAHRIGQKKDVLVLRLETVNSVEEQVRASAEHKLGVANQSITAGFFDNNTSAEDRREYLEALLRESKKEEAAPVLNDDGLNDLLARSEPEIDVFESIDQKRREEEMTTWKRLTMEMGTDDSQVIPPLPSRLVTEDDLNAFYEAMKRYEVSADGSASDVGMKRKAGSTGAFDTKHYGRGKRAREVRSYEEQWSEEEFEKMCQTESLDTLKLKEEQIDPQLQVEASLVPSKTEPPLQIQQPPPLSSAESSAIVKNDVTPPVKRGRGRPRRIPLPTPASVPTPTGPVKPNTDIQNVITPIPAITGSSHDLAAVSKDTTSRSDATQSVIPTHSGIQSTSPGLSATAQPVRRRGRKPGRLSSTVSASLAVQDTQPSEQLAKQASVDGGPAATAGLQSPSEQSKPKVLQDPCASVAEPSAGSSTPPIVSANAGDVAVEMGPSTIATLLPANEVSTPSGLENMSGRRQSLRSPIVSANAGDVAVEMGPSTIATLLPANEVSTPSGLENMSGRRQSLRSQSGVEPVRRRGRRPKNAATTVAAPSTQNFNSKESNKNSQVSVPQPLKVIAAPPVSVNLSVGSQENASVSLHNVSVGFVPMIPAASQPYSSTALSSHTEGQNQKRPAGESAPLPPRRRGRKKGSSVAAGSNNLASQDKSPSLSENILKNSEEKRFATTSQGKDVIQSPALVIPDSKPEAQHGVSSKPNELSDAASSLDKGPIEANKSDKNVEVSNVSLTKEVQMSSLLLKPPCTGSTTVIVLALKASALTTHKEDARTDADAEHTLSQSEVNVAARTDSTDHLDEDLTAPPGFDNPHAYTTDAAVVGVPFPSEDGKGKEDDVAANKSLTDPVEILQDDSAPPGFEPGDTCTLLTRDASSSEASEPPPGFGKDALPPGFGVAQAHPTEVGSENIVSSGIGDVLSETGAIQTLGQDQTTTEDNKDQSSSEERNESYPTLQTETLDGHLDMCGNEELEDCAIVVQEEKGHGKQETTVYDLSAARDNESFFSETKNVSIAMRSEINTGKMDILQKNDDYRGQDDASTDINVDVGPDFAMSEQEIIQKSSLESFSRDGIKTQSYNNIIIDGSREDEDPLKKLQGATEVHISYRGAPVILEPEVEHESNNNTNLVGSLAELRQPTAETLTAGHNPAVALHDEGKDGNDEPTDTGVDDCKSKTYAESRAETRELSEKSASIIAAVQKDEGSLGILENADNVPNIAEPVEQPTESVAAQAEACLSLNGVDLDEGGRNTSSSIKDEVEHIQPVMRTLTDVYISCTDSVIYDEKQSVEVPDTALRSALSSDLSVSASKDEIGGVQSALHAASTGDVEASMQIVEENNSIMETRQNCVEWDEPQQEKPSESFGGLKQLEGKGADFGETCTREYSSTEMDTNAHDTVNDTSEVMDICTNLINHSGTADDVASSMPQIQNEESLSSPSLEGKVEKSTHKLEAPSSISFTCQKDEAHSGKHYDANAPSSLHVEASGGALQLDLVSNAEESHGACVGKQELYCEIMSGNDSSPTEGHIRSSDAGDVMGLASKVDCSEGCSEAVAPGDEDHSEKSHDKSDDEAGMAMALKVDKSEEPNVEDEDEQCKTTDEVGNCSTAFSSYASEAHPELADECKEKELQGPDAPEEEEQPKNKADDNDDLSASAVCLGAFEAVPASKFEESQGASDVQMKDTIVRSSPSETNSEESTCILSETDGQKDEIDSEIGQNAEHEASTGDTNSPQRPTVANQPDSICTSEVPKDETGASKDEIDSQRTIDDVCMTSDAVVKEDQTDPGADCSAAKEKIESPLGDTEMQEIEEEQDASSGPVATQLEVTCTVLGSEIDKDKADPEILLDAEFIVPENEVDASNDPEELESQKLSVIVQSEEPCDTQISMEKQEQSQEKVVFLVETSDDGHDTNNAKMLDTDLQAAKAEIDASQTCEDKSEFLEFSIGADMKASDKDSTVEGHENKMNSEKQVDVHIVRDKMEVGCTVTEIESEKNENPSEALDKEIGEEKNETASEVPDKETEGEKSEIPAEVHATKIEGKNKETPYGILDKEIEDNMNETTSDVPNTEIEDEEKEIPSEATDTDFEGEKIETSSEVPATEIEGEKNENLSELPAEAGARVIKDEVGSQAEAASTISELECQKSETAPEAGISRDMVASPVLKDVGQKSEGEAEMQANVNNAEKIEDEIGAPETHGCEDLSQDQKTGALTAAETSVSEIECQNNEESWKKIIRALFKAAYKVLKTERLKNKYDPAADADTGAESQKNKDDESSDVGASQHEVGASLPPVLEIECQMHEDSAELGDESRKTTVEPELEADPLVLETECQKDECDESADEAGAPKREVSDSQMAQTEAQKDETDADIAGAVVDTRDQDRKDETDAAVLVDVKASVDEENASQPPQD